jgi:hypothetical protein
MLKNFPCAWHQPPKVGQLTKNVESEAITCNIYGDILVSVPASLFCRTSNLASRLRVSFFCAEELVSCKHCIMRICGKGKKQLSPV